MTYSFFTKQEVDSQKALEEYMCLSGFALGRRSEMDEETFAIVSVTRPNKEVQGCFALDAESDAPGAPLHLYHFLDGKRTRFVFAEAERGILPAGAVLAAKNIRVMQEPLP
ncbi:MAG TPA: hypothetical protein VGE35_04200 [Candidatus Paceibacterota bacterium]